jgi:hypothetical protein
LESCCFRLPARDWATTSKHFGRSSVRIPRLGGSTFGFAFSAIPR